MTYEDRVLKALDTPGAHIPSWNECEFCSALIGDMKKHLQVTHVVED